MKNIFKLSNTLPSVLDSKTINHLMTKLSGDNITAILVTTIVAGTLCHVCNNGGNLEITSGDNKVVLNSSGKAA